ncbi:hypothetical protein VNO80_13241 [Phaseolus coccineus]|uniref:Uncharacterized protein n=1 Tax=Phaseolus coccineus TaxID=3886 RepID=A0AAN9N1C3_PHACN
MPASLSRPGDARMPLAPWRCPHASRPGDVRMPRALAMSACLAPWRCPHASRPGDVRIPRALAMSACLAPWRCSHTSRPGDTVLVASNCNPRWLMKHLLSLASTRSVPLIFVRDNKHGSLRLGELNQLKTAIAIGIKEAVLGVKGSKVPSGSRFGLTEVCALRFPDFPLFTLS